MTVSQGRRQAVETVAGLASDRHGNPRGSSAPLAYGCGPRLCPTVAAPSRATSRAAAGTAVFASDGPAAPAFYQPASQPRSETRRTVIPTMNRPYPVAFDDPFADPPFKGHKTRPAGYPRSCQPELTFLLVSM